MKTKTMPLLATALMAVPVLAQPAPVPRFEPARLSADIQTMSSDAFEGRGPGTAGEARTVDYLVARMKAAGLQPGGKAGQWMQDVPLLQADIVGVPRLSIDLAGTPTPLTQGEEIAVRAALTGAKQVRLADVPLVFIGYGVSAPERRWDDFKGVDLKGKVAVVLVNDPDFEAGEGRFGGRAMTYYGRWTYKYEEAARRGAAGVLVVHETEPASYGWATVRNSNINTMFDIVRKRPTLEHSALEGWIQRDLAVKLFQASGLDFDAVKKQAQAPDFRPISLKATLSADYQVAPRVIVSKNVVGKVVGARRPDETVLYTAHWDHLGIGQPDANGDTIYNGALDNATGTAALLELGRAFAAAPAPERTVVFLAVTAEEKGLLGSEYYAANPLYPLAKTAGVFNIDGANVNGPARNFTISGSAKLDLLDDLAARARTQGRAYSPDPHPEAGSFYRSDHFSFAKQGVPAVSFDGGDDLVDGGVTRGKALWEAYVQERYHQPADEWSADWNYDGFVQDLTLLYDVGRDLANSSRWPNWGEDSEFRRVRDASAARRH